MKPNLIVAVPLIIEKIKVEYDWEMGKLTIDGEKWKSYLRNE